MRTFFSLALSFMVGLVLFGIVMMYVGGGDCSRGDGRADPSQSVFNDCRE